jgi:hypothetical protein
LTEFEQEEFSFRAFFNKHGRTLVGLALFAYLAIYVMWALLNPPPKETPAQAIALQQALDDQSAKERQRNYYCHAATVCRLYSSVRQDCAVAGNFDKCVSVKMGKNSDLTYECTEDGSLQNPPRFMTGAELWTCSIFGHEL